MNDCDYPVVQRAFISNVEIAPTATRHADLCLQFRSVVVNGPTVAPGAASAAVVDIICETGPIILAPVLRNSIAVIEP